jgi:hypothetical protein
MDSPKGLNKTAQGCREAKPKRLPWVTKPDDWSTLKGLRRTAMPLHNPFRVNALRWIRAPG